MLRLVVLLLILVNACFFVWSRGMLSVYGFAPASQSEPQRMTQQLRPEAMRILEPAPARSPSPGAAASAPGTSANAMLVLASSMVQTSALLDASPTQCLQAGLFNEEQTAVLRARLASTLPAGSWVLESSMEPAQYMVYMGKYSSEEVVQKKRGELRYLKVAFEALTNPALEPGVSLGTFASQADAEAALARAARSGVRTARVIQAAPETRGQRLKLPAVSAASRSQIDALKPQLAGRALQTCS